MVNGADTPEAAWQAFHAALSRQGLDRAALHLDLPRRAANPFADHPGARAFGLVWDAALDAQLRGHAGDVRRAEARALWHLRPTLLFLSMFRKPLFIDHGSVLECPRDTPFAPISRTMLEDVGQHQALSIPLVDPRSKRLSMLTFWGDEPGPDFGDFARAHMGALQAAGLCFAGLLALRWPQGPAHATPALSSRERQILSALAEGAQIDCIADGLGISERSVREYIARARAKLGAGSRTEAVARALVMGIIDPGR
jgi:DNA-binding CsgD family transcriptional regulator